MIIRLAPHIKGDTFSGEVIELSTKFMNNVHYIYPIPIDLTGCVVNCYFYTDRYETLFKTFTNGDGIEILNASQGKFVLLKNEVIDWNIQTYYFEIKVVYPDSSIKTFVNGTWSIGRELNYDTENPNLFVPTRVQGPLDSETDSYYGGCLGEDNICATRIQYCDEPWIDKICAPYIINQGNMSPNLEFIVMQKKDFFGDNSYMDLTDFDVFIYIYNEDNLLKIKGKCDFINRKQGFIRYKWDKFDTLDTGNFSCIFKLIHITSGEEIIITNKDNRVDIIIK